MGEPKRSWKNCRICCSFRNLLRGYSAGFKTNNIAGKIRQAKRKYNLTARTKKGFGDGLDDLVDSHFRQRIWHDSIIIQFSRLGQARREHFFDASCSEQPSGYSFASNISMARSKTRLGSNSKVPSNFCIARHDANLLFERRVYVTETTKCRLFHYKNECNVVERLYCLH